MISRNSRAMLQLDAIQSDSGVSSDDMNKSKGKGVAKLGADKACFALLKECYLVEQLCRDDTPVLINSSTSQVAVYNTATLVDSDDTRPAFTERDTLNDIGIELYDAAMHRVINEPHVVNVLHKASLCPVPSGWRRDCDPSVQSSLSDDDADDDDDNNNKTGGPLSRSRCDNFLVVGMLNSPDTSSSTRTTVVVMWGLLADDSPLLRTHYPRPDTVAYSAWLLTKRGSVYVAHFMQATHPWRTHSSLFPTVSSSFH